MWGTAKRKKTFYFARGHGKILYMCAYMKEMREFGGIAMKSKHKVKGRLKIYLLWPVLLTGWWVIAAGLLLMVNRNAGLVAFGATFVYFVVTLVMYLLRRKYILKDYVEFAMDYGQVQRKMLKELKVPYGVMDAEGMLLWCNDEFCALSERERAGYNIRELMPDVKAFSLPKHDKEERNYRTTLGDKNCRVIFRMMDTPEFQQELQALELADSQGRTQKMIAVFLYDETEIMLLKQENFDRRQIVGLLYIDNYDEVLESFEEVKRSLLSALVDRKITKYMQDIDAIIKKVEKDKYFFVFQNRYLASMTENKFSILEEVRSVSMGTAESSVTISIGLGVNAESYVQGYEYARAAMDLALGRGGDQAVVKDGEMITYYGGKSESIEKNTRVKARVKAHALREFIEGKDSIFIMGHANADVDSLGAAIGVYRIAKHFGKKAYIVLNEMGSAVRPMASKFLNNPDYEESMIISNIRAQELATEDALLVVVDVNRPGYTECPELFDQIRQVIVLDHHRKTSDSIENAALSYVEPYASSACELVAEVLQYIGDGLKLRPLEAEAMYAGIMIDTNNFLTKTGVRTFEAAAYLRRNGADVTRIRKAFRTDINEYLEKAKAISAAEFYLEQYAFAITSAAGVESPTILGAQVANELLEINGIKASFVFTEYKDRVYISARSIDELNVQVVMEKLGGGGHMSVAGAQLSDVTPKEAMRRVKEVLTSMKGAGEI